MPIGYVRIEGKTVLITGGATGIGLAMAGLFLKRGCTVAVCGRRENRLYEAAGSLHGLRTLGCDISKEGDRDALMDWVKSDLHGIDVLVNNAGIQRRIDLRKGTDDIVGSEDEIETNFRAQVRLSAHFIPVLSERDESAIVNVTSGLGFVPMAAFPIYSATKAAMHSFTMSLRRQLEQTPIRVFEVIPPTVHDTELKGRPVQKTDWSVSSSEVAEATISGIESDAYEIAVGQSRGWSNASRAELDAAFNRINASPVG